MNRILVQILLVQASSVNKRRFRLELLFEVAVGALPSFDPEPVELVLERLPAEVSLLVDLLQRFVTLELLRAGLLLVFLQIVVQINLDCGAVHGLPDVVQAQVDDLLKHGFINR